MYNSNPMLPITGGGALVAGANGIWWLLGSFALIAAGCAIGRIRPKKVND